MVVRRFEVWLIELDPTVGSEIQKTRPCVIISPNEVNQMMRCIIAAPMTSTTRPYPFRLATTFKRRKGQLAFDQMRTFDKSRLVKKLGALSEEDARATCGILGDLFRFE